MNVSLLSVENLQLGFAHEKGVQPVLNGLSFALDRGETLALVGESGSGKSVTALSMLKLLPAQTTRYDKDSRIVFDGQSILDGPETCLRDLRGKRMAMIFQEPMSSLNPFMRIGEQLAEAVRAHFPQTSKKAAQAKASEMLARVQIADPARRLKQFPHEFSGGQLQRIMIAMALINEPDILIADEPTTALDVTIQAEILQLLKQLQEALGMAMLFITHDLTLAERYSDRVCVMHGGEIVEQGEIGQVFRDPKHAYTRKLLNATPQGRKIPVAENAPTLLQTEALGVDFITARNFFGHAKQRFTAVNGLSLELREGETLGVVGESGSGKSTLGKAILQMLEYHGDVRFRGQTVKTLSATQKQALKADMQMVFQDPFDSLSPRLTVGEIIAEGLRVHQPELGGKARREQVATMLAEVALSANMINRYPHEFSGGQRQRIAIARALIVRPRFVVLDEPTSALDRSIQVMVVELLRELQQKHGLSYLFISHDLAVVKAMSDRVLVMQGGKCVESGPAEQVFHHPENPYTRRLLSAAFFT